MPFQPVHIFIRYKTHKYGLLRSLILVSACLSCEREGIDVLFGLETPEDPIDTVLDGVPTRTAR